MKAKDLVVAVLSVLFLPMVLCSPAYAQGTAFTYQGRLAANGSDANGNFDFTFGLYTNVATGNLIGTLETNAAVAVSNGVFTTTLNFSNAFNGTAYWLGIGVRSNGTTNAFTALTPRQPITPTPYAITASNLTGTIQGSQITSSIPASVVSGTFSNSVSFTNLTNIFAGNGSALTEVESVTSSNILYCYDTGAQYISSVGNFQTITFTENTGTGWTILSSGEFEPNQTGEYLVQYQAHFYNTTGNGTFSGCVRAILNSTEIAGSEAVIYVPASTIGLASRSFVVPITAGQLLYLQVTGSIAGDGGGYLLSGTYYGQFFPGAAITITRLQ